MQKAYRYRLNPTDDEMQMMTRIIGCCRFVWNRLLEYCSKSYKRRGESHTAFDLNNFI
ncbi:MAG: helix-turn-helix domain-containing protein, partial [Spirochaetes bacterium]|nr:helix-turn-helix domain-containing protein [Candidatus Ornithospirochaeta stercoripullorum]